MTLNLWRRSRTGQAVALGAVLALAIALRPFNLGAALGLAVALMAYGRLRDALVTGLAAVGVLAALLTIPIAVHASFTGVSAASELGFYPMSPLRMLFSDHRGLFTWTPLTLLATIGMAIRLARQPRDGYLVALSAMAAGLLAFYVFFKTWDGGWSFSARFLSSLLPFYSVGVGTLLSDARHQWRAAVRGVVVLATAWSLFIGMNHAFGADMPDGVSDIAGAYVTGQRTPHDFARLAWSYSRVRHVIQALERR
jgi:hypothetical protein